MSNKEPEGLTDEQISVVLATFVMVVLLSILALIIWAWYIDNKKVEMDYDLYGKEIQE